MASRRPMYTLQLTGYATESNEKKCICCFMRVTHAINNIYKLISFFEIIVIMLMKIGLIILIIIRDSALSKITFVMVISVS